MEVPKVKVKDIRNGAIYEVRKSLASDYIGTGDFELVKEELEEKEEKKSNFFKSNEK